MSSSAVDEWIVVAGSSSSNDVELSNARVTMLLCDACSKKELMVAGSTITLITQGANSFSSDANAYARIDCSSRSNLTFQAMEGDIENHHDCDRCGWHWHGELRRLFVIADLEWDCGGHWVNGSIGTSRGVRLSSSFDDYESDNRQWECQPHCSASSSCHGTGIGRDSGSGGISSVDSL
jgi:hypothetical protein